MRGPNLHRQLIPIRTTGIGAGLRRLFGDGDVMAPIVRDYGLPSDYAQLSALGVDNRGKLVIARYGTAIARSSCERRNRPALRAF